LPDDPSDVRPDGGVTDPEVCSGLRQASLLDFESISAPVVKLLYRIVIVLDAIIIEIMDVATIS
jgi:hypothetical protein